MLNTITFNTWPPTELSLHRQDSASGNTKHNNVKHGIRWPTVATDRVVTTTVRVYITHSLEDAHRQGMLNYTIYQHLTQRQVCHWRQLPQVSLSLLQTFCCKKKHACHDKTFVATNIFSSFATTNIILSRQKFCRNKLTFVTRSLLLPRQTHLLSRQKYACHDKSFVATNIRPRQT